MSKKNPSGVPEQDIIELTDVIEEPVLAKNGATAEAEGMDMGFQQELDDLFADGGVAGDAQSAATAGPVESPPHAPEDDLDLSDLESGADFDLRLPEELTPPSSATAAKADDSGIDMAGLDALLQEGTISTDETAANDALAQTAPASPEQYPPIESTGLDDLDSLLAGADLEPNLDEAMAGDGPQDEDLIDLDSLMADSGLDDSYPPETEALSQTGAPSPDAVAQRMAAIENKLEQIAAAQHLAIMDLADSLKMAKTPAIDLDALAAALQDKLADSLAARVEKILDDRLAALTHSTSTPPDLSAAVSESLETQLAELRDAVLAEIRTLAPDAQAMKDELRAEIDRAVPAAAAKIIREEIAALANETD
jgi:pilus assembly protein FimV